MARQIAKHFQFGRFKLASPTFFASYRLGDYPTAGLHLFPWDITGTEALLINAYDLRRPKNQPAINNGWNPATNLGFAGKPILVDSGAYYFLHHEKMVVKPGEILKLQIKSKADIGVVLDHPFSPKATDKPERLRRTLRNTREMLRQLAESKTAMELMPVLHGEGGRDVGRFLARLRKVLDAEGVALKRVGIGSLAPLAQSGNIAPAAEIIQRVRAELPETHVHCFSMGSALLMLLAFYSGADSVDSQSWILSAAFKYAQLPGHYVTRMARREYGNEADFKVAMREFANRLQRLADREGFCVRHWDTGEALDMSNRSVRDQYVVSLVDVHRNENIHNRACHNLCVYNFEVRQYRRAANEGRLTDHLRLRLGATRYAKALAEVVARDNRRGQSAG